MSIGAALRSFFKIGSTATKTASAGAKTASVASRSASVVGKVTGAGKTIINAAKGSKIVIQVGKVGEAAAKGIQAGARASKAWILAKWGVAAAIVVGVGVGIKNILSGLFGSAYRGVSTILQSFGLSPENADTGTSILFVALFVAIILYALPYIMDRIPERKQRPNRTKRIREKVKKEAKDDWVTLTTREGPKERPKEGSK